MTKSFAAFALGLLGIAAQAFAGGGSKPTSDLLQCGDAFYDPAVYICHPGNFLCPVINGEPLSYCNGACYSKFMYQCVRRRHLALLPELPQGTKITLRAKNPAVPALHNLPVNACGGKLNVGGKTCTYCPDVVQPNCPRGTETSLVYPDYMNTMVPGGQNYYLDPELHIAYTQAHSTYIPAGSVRGGLAAYEGGGLVNLNGIGSGWFACPPPPGGQAWALFARNETNADKLTKCTGVNLEVTKYTGEWVWQYT